MHLLVRQWQEGLGNCNGQKFQNAETHPKVRGPVMNFSAWFNLTNHIIIINNWFFSTNPIQGKKTPYIYMHNDEKYETLKKWYKLILDIEINDSVYRSHKGKI